MSQHPGVTIDDTGAVRVVDPHGLRVLAHPARQHAIDRLYDGDVLTATELADSCGLTPSAMSYHLRTLERWGLVRRDESQDGRERPWRAAGQSLTVTPQAIASSEYAQAAEFVRTFVAPLSDHLTRLARTLTELHDQGEDLAARGTSAVLYRSRMWLTKDEFLALSRQITSLIDDYQRSLPADRPDGAMVYDAYLSVLPRDLGGSNPSP